MKEIASPIVKSLKKKRPRRAKFHKKNHWQSSTFLPIPSSFKKHKSYGGKKKNFNYISKMELVNKYVPHNLKYIISKSNSPFNIRDIKKDTSTKSSNGTIYIPDNFSIIDNPNSSYNALRQIISALFIEDNVRVSFDYSNCCHIDIGTQALMDVIIMEYDLFVKKCLKLDKYLAAKVLPQGIGGCNINHDNLKKMIFSIGSPAVLGIKQADFPDIIRNSMCSHSMLTAKDCDRLSMQKEIDTTIMVDYVVNCLAKMNKTLTPKKLNDLSTVVGEILINAEEHSSLHHRFSVGYFQDTTENGKHYGMLKLVILNFGSTIYEKFKDVENCPEEVASRMRRLSERYTKRNLFKSREFEEETLWTLYALQQGVTSVVGKRRGSGTIQFIRSFFNIKGNQFSDNVSRMIIHSGNTQIVFDGTYGITEKIVGNNKFNMMTFNDSGNIEDMPDQKFVKFTDTYFPGTIITANILLNDDDIKEVN